jgi:hypothetical protein
VARDRRRSQTQLPHSERGDNHNRTHRAFLVRPHRHQARYSLRCAICHPLSNNAGSRNIEDSQINQILHPRQVRAKSGQGTPVALRGGAKHSRM